MKEDKKKVFIKNFGCQMNTRDSEVICGLLRTTNYALITDPNDADIVILNTCSVRQHAEDKVWSEIGRISKQNEVTSHLPAGRQGKSQVARKIIGIVGCMAQNYKENIFQRAPAVDFVVGTADIHKIPEIIEKLLSVVQSSEFIVHRKQKKEHAGQRAIKRAQRIENNEQKGWLFERKIWETEGKERPEEVYHTGFYEDKEHAFVVISEGCSNYCSYCVVPYVRGEIHHRDANAILKEIEEAVAKGITKVTLLGQNVNAYRSAVNFIELLRLVNDIEDLKEFSFITSHPKDASPELFKVMADLEKVKKHLHLPLQSGSDRILTLMNRGYSAKFYLDLIDKYRTILPYGVLTTDIIVGFPSETEREFRDTFDLVTRAEFNAAFIFKYSPRPHTKAANYMDDVSGPEKKRRHALLLELQKKVSKKKK